MGQQNSSTQPWPRLRQGWWGVPQTPAPAVFPSPPEDVMERRPVGPDLPALDGWALAREPCARGHQLGSLALPGCSQVSGGDRLAGLQDPAEPPTDRMLAGGIPTWPAFALGPGSEAGDQGLRGTEKTGGGWAL